MGYKIMNPKIIKLGLVTIKIYRGDATKKLYLLFAWRFPIYK